MKRLFFIIFLSLPTIGMLAQNVRISPTVCGLTVGETTTNGQTLAQWDDLIQHEGMKRLISSSASDQVYYGDFVVEGFHLSLMHIELINDTIYKISFYEKSPYADCWDAYKDIAFRMRDKYAELENLTKPDTLVNDSAVMLFKTDGKTRLLFAAYPDQITYELTNEHFNDIYLQKLYEEFNSLFTGKTGPDYDEKNKVTSVAGVNFGDSKENVKRVISAKSDRLLQSDEYSLNFYKVRVGGTTYEYAKFYFKKGEGLVSVNLQQPFRSWRKEEALMMYENTKSVYQRKYTNYRDVVDEDENKGGVCGAYEDGYMPIIISFTKSLSQGGDIMYYVQVDYFHNRIATLYDNDI